MKLRKNIILSTSPQTQPARKSRRVASLTLRQQLLYGKPHRYNTGKELDPETGLYYYGARYLDPRVSRWLSGDPALGEYVPQAGRKSGSLPGMGGVYNTTNLHTYHYANNNPVKYVDPDGREADAIRDLYFRPSSDAFNPRDMLFRPGIDGNHSVSPLTNAADVLYKSWAIAGSAALADGPIPIGDTIALVIGIGGTLIATGVFIYNSVREHNDEATRGARAILIIASTAAVPPPPDDPNSKGTQTPSKTLYNRNGTRIDVENPGNRPGQIQLQQGNSTYIYDVAKRMFVTRSGEVAPPVIQRFLENPNVIKAVAKGLRYLGY